MILTGIKFSHGLQINIFALQSDLLHRLMWNLAQLRGTWVRLAVQNFTPIYGNVAPEMAKISTFGKESPASVSPFTDFYNC